MTPEQITTIVTNVLTGSGITVFLWMIIRGLKREILSLNQVVNTQKKTLEAMETRVLETEKVGNIYRKFIEELPEDIEKFKAVHKKLKDELITELEMASQKKDEKLKANAEIELQKLEIQQRAIDELPQLREELIEVINSVFVRMDTVNKLSHLQPFNYIDVYGAVQRESIRRLASQAALIDNDQIESLAGEIESALANQTENK